MGNDFLFRDSCVLRYRLVLREVFISTLSMKVHFLSFVLNSGFLCGTFFPISLRSPNSLYYDLLRLEVFCFFWWCLPFIDPFESTENREFKNCNVLITFGFNVTTKDPEYYMYQGCVYCYRIDCCLSPLYFLVECSKHMKCWTCYNQSSPLWYFCLTFLISLYKFNDLFTRFLNSTLGRTIIF